jgi:hypothetical protein
MRVARCLAISLVALAALASACSAICTVEQAEVVDGISRDGAVKVPLLAATDDGAQYRLSEATVRLESDEGDASSITLSSEEAADLTTLSSEVHAGTYKVSLDDGWQLERLEGDTWTVVDAELASEASQTITVEDDSTLVVAFAFEVAGTAVTTGVGQMNIEISVTEAAAAN